MRWKSYVLAFLQACRSLGLRLPLGLLLLGYTFHAIYIYKHYSSMYPSELDQFILRMEVNDLKKMSVDADAANKLLRPQSEHYVPQLTHLIIPFVERQVDTLQKNFDVWKEFPPFVDHALLAENSLSTKPQPPSASKITLLFQYAGAYNASIEMAVMKIASPVSKFFEKISFLPANTPPKLNNHDQGTQYMLMQLLKQDSIPGYAFLMEPDTVPLVPDWLGRLQHEVNSSPFFLLRGALFHSDMSSIPARFFRHMDIHRLHTFVSHINGNAVYNVGHGGLRRFLEEHVHPYALEASPDSAIPYDLELSFYMNDPANFYLASYLAPYMQPTEAIINLCLSRFSLPELLQMDIHATFPRALLVHRNGRF